MPKNAMLIASTVRLEKFMNIHFHEIMIGRDYFNSLWVELISE